ncbi:hypothetical protein Tco_1166220 [Tanacetum coccineum]
MLQICSQKHLIYALAVNPTIYTACIKQLWATAKAKTINGEVQIQALVDRKKNWKEWGMKILHKSLHSIKLSFHLNGNFLSIQFCNALMLRLLLGTNLVTIASAIICLATNQNFNFSKYIFDNMVKNLQGEVKFQTYPRFVQVFLDKQVEGMSKHKEIYVTPYHTKKVFANIKREGKGFSGRVTLLFQTMMVQAQEEGEGSAMPTDPQHTPTITQSSTSQPQKKQPRRKQRKDTEHVPTHSNDPLLSGEDRLKLNKLMELCTNLSQRVLDLEKTKTSQAAEITELKEWVKRLEKKGRSRTHKLKRLRKIGRSTRVVSSEDVGLGDQEDASKQGKRINEIDHHVEVTLIDETQGRNDDNLIDTTTTVDELTLAQTLIEIKEAKPKAVITAATTTVTRPKARGVIVQEPSEFIKTTSPSQPSQLPQAKDKGKAKMIEPEKPLKKKDQILIDEEIAQKFQA